MEFQELADAAKKLPLAQRLDLMEKLVKWLRADLLPQTEDDWQQLSAQGLSAAYGEDEPEYPTIPKDG